MSDTFFQNGTIITASWLNDLNKLNYSVFGNPSTQSAIDHNGFSNSGSVRHVDLDAHVASTDIHFSDAPSDGQTYGRRDGSWILGSGGGGTDDHSLLNNLAADDHSQYHNDERGDARYLQKLGTTGGSEMSGPLFAKFDAQLQHNDSTDVNLRTWQDGIIVGDNSAAGNLSVGQGMQVFSFQTIEHETFSGASPDYALALSEGDLYVDRTIDATGGIVTQGTVSAFDGMYSGGNTLGDTMIWGTGQMLDFSGGDATRRSGFVSSVTKISDGEYRLNLSTAVTSKTAVLVLANYTTFGGAGVCRYDSSQGTNSQLYIHAVDSSGNDLNAAVDVTAFVINTNTQAP